MFQMCSEQTTNRGILLVMLLDLIVSVSRCLEHCHKSKTLNWEVVKSFVLLWSYFRL